MMRAGLGNISTSQGSSRRRDGRAGGFRVSAILTCVAIGGAVTTASVLANAQSWDATRTASLPPTLTAPDREVLLPAILAPAEAARYRRIFDAQSRGDWSSADREIDRLGDRRLLGHVLAQRYLHPRYRTSYGELVHWLGRFADHPDAPAIHQLALRRAGPGAAPAPAPSVGPAVYGALAADELRPPSDLLPSPGRRASSDESPRVSGLKNEIRNLLRIGELELAERVVRSRETARVLAPVEQDIFKAAIAAGWFARGDTGKAFELAGEAARRSGVGVPRANWIAGLALYRQGRHLASAVYFEALARTPGGQPWDIAAGAFWTARAYLQGKRFDQVNYWLGLAAEQPRSFYGLIAARALGVMPDLNLDVPPLTESEVDQLQRRSGGARALALLQIGEQGRAEAELRRLPAGGSEGFTRALLAIAMRNNMPDLSVALGRELAEFDGRTHDGALYPIPRWRPAGGFEIDRALLFAIARQESAFNPRAASPAGARGLMQIMPQTATHLTSGQIRGNFERLYDPAFSLTLGQRYIRTLLENEIVQGDLILLAAAYNGGPGNLSRWKKRGELIGEANNDPLLFIESLPSPETRHFIARVLYHYWMYAMRLAQPTPSLDAIAAGDWPTYIAVDDEARNVARNAKD